MQGKGVVKRPDLAQRWNDKAAAQQQRDALLLQAKQASPTHAFATYQRAANAGSAEAELWLGMAYLAGSRYQPTPLWDVTGWSWLLGTAPMKPSTN